ncbi:MAG TPA: ABC transporter ATP-binding protein [Patescibacteria group bacterium]|nr:ABC transporter ATP-binding protein [Patescibacteria group bacterium]
MYKILKTFFRFATTNRLGYTMLVAGAIMAGALDNLIPYFYKLFVDAIPTLNYPTLLRILIFYIATSVLSLFFVEISFWFGDKATFDAAKLARQEIFAWVQDLDFVFHSNKSTGSLISAFKRGDNAFFDLFFILHHRILDITVSIIVMFCFFIALDFRIAIIAGVSIILTLIIANFFISLNVKRRRIFNEEEDNVSDIITDNMLNYETVKLFAREKFEKTRLANAFKPWYKSLWDFTLTYRYIDITLGTLFNITIFAILFFSIVSTTNLHMTVGSFVLVTAFISILFPRLWDLVWSLRDISKSFTDLQKYFGLLDYAIEVKDPSKPVNISRVSGIINFNNVHFTYNGRSKNAINGINLKVEEGQSIALVGRSGSGKTTLAKLLMRFYDLDSGEITVDGINIKDFNKSTLRSFVGVVPQEPILFNNTIAYNIGYGKDNPKLSEIKSASKLANIDTFIDSLKLKYNTEVGERGVKLSGGQKQRLAIARMILSDPDIVVFDEATSHLDSESEKLIQDAFWKARRGKTTIIIAHRLSTIMRADKIVVMENGKIKEVGTHKELVAKKGSLYSHFWNLQIKLD